MIADLRAARRLFALTCAIGSLGALPYQSHLWATPRTVPPLFSAVGGSPNGIAEADAQARSRWAVTVDLKQLSAIHQAGAGFLTLNLFDNAAFAGTVTQVTTQPSAFSLRGRLDGHPQGWFDLVVHGDAVAGTLRDGEGGAYRIRYGAVGVHWVERIETGAFPPCSQTPQFQQRVQREVMGRVAAGATAGQSSAAVAGEPSVDSGSVLDILVLYSDVTRAAAGGTNAIRAEIQLAVDVANDAYVASGIGTRLRLVHMDEVVYDEVTGWDGFEDHVVRLWDPEDGYFDQAHELRDLYGADLVSLIVEDSHSDTIGATTCGIAPVMQEMSPEFESLALSAVNRECSADNWSLAHEVGHNQGCAHNRENAGIAGLFSYSYGHWFTGHTRGWRSIMAYDSGDTWQRVGHFSNPNVLYDGAATGAPIGTTDEAHNAATINATKTTVARFRTTRYWVDFDWSGTQTGLFDAPFATLSAGMDAVPQGGMVVVKSGSYADGIVLTKPMRINSWNGSTILGAPSP